MIISLLNMTKLYHKLCNLCSSIILVLCMSGTWTILSNSSICFFCGAMQMAPAANQKHENWANSNFGSWSHLEGMSKKCNFLI